MAGFWSVILPVQKVNFVTNPSGEYGTATWGTVSAGTVGTTSQYQQFGAWAGSYAPTSNTNCGALVQVGTALAAGDYTISAYVRGANGIPYRLAIAARGGAALGSTTFTGGGTWQRYSFGYTEVGGAPARDVWITKANSNDTSAIYFDGVQVEAGSVTTYIDGEEDGCLWLGAPQASMSLRDDQVRTGGSVIPLSDLGFAVDTMAGVGMPPIQNTAQSYALTDGAQFQRSRAAERPFTLTSYINGPGGGTALQGLHEARRTFINTIKPDLVTPQQPIRFQYTGAGGTTVIDAIYDGGMDFGALDGFMENAAVRFVAYDPYWYTATQQGTALAPRTAIGSVHNIVNRSPLGKWGTMNGGALNASYGVAAFAERNGTLFVGGDFNSAGGTTMPSIGFWVPSAQTWGSLGGGPTGTVETMAITPSGTLYFGGVFLGVAGTAGARRLAQYANGAFGTLIGGTVDGEVTTIQYNPSGTLLVGGGFSSAAGTTARYAAQWVNNAWGTLNGQHNGTINDFVMASTLGLDGKFYIGGMFTQAGAHAAPYIAFWANSFGTLGSGLNGTTQALTTAPDGQIVVGGTFTTAGGVSASNAAVWNGVQFSALGSGLLYTTTPSQLKVYGAHVDKSGAIRLGGLFNYAGGINLPDSLAQYNGGAWVPFDIDLPGQTLINVFYTSPTGELYVGGTFNGTAQAASVGTIVNSGMAAVYPTLRMRNIGTTTTRVFQIGNATTGDNIYFYIALLSGEEATLDLSPGQRSFTSSFRGNVFNQIIPGSNLATWRLLPGTNYVSFFAAADTLDISLYWTPRAWSIDQGTA